MNDDTHEADGTPRPKGKGTPPKAADQALGTVAPLAAPPVTAKGKARASAGRKAAKAAKAERGKRAAKEARVSMKLRVPKELRKAFREAAAARDTKRGALFARIFADWRSRNPD